MLYLPHVKYEILLLHILDNTSGCSVNEFITTSNIITNLSKNLQVIQILFGSCSKHSLPEYVKIMTITISMNILLIQNRTRTEMPWSSSNW